MSIDAIGPINNYNNIQKINNKKPTGETESSDSVSISKEALDMAEKNKIMEILKNTPDIREDKIKEVKEKMKDPDYINDTVTDTLADQMMDLFKI